MLIINRPAEPFHIITEHSEAVDPGISIDVCNTITRINEIERQVQDIASHEQIYGRIRQMHQVLRDRFGLEYFNYEQERVIYRALKREDVFVVSPINSGKSLCFQLPAIIEDGVTVVISPILALISDQIDALDRLSIPVGKLTSEQSVTEKARVERSLLAGTCKLLYITPEKLLDRGGLGFLRDLQKRVGLARFVVDEAHLICSWGHRFRPAYLELGDVRTIFPNVPIMALTATATAEMITEIKQKLQMLESSVIVGDLNQPNLIYTVRIKEEDEDIVKDIMELLNSSPRNSTINPSSKGIVYCRRTQRCRDLASMLSQCFAIKGKVWYFHSIITKERKDHIIRSFRSNELDSCQIVVATTAFGMGVDIPDVRFVVHADPPESLLAYMQESGRAGRDGKMALSILYYSPIDFMKNLGQNQKDPRQTLEIQRLQQYCGDFTACRRAMLLEYFNQPSAEHFPANCRKTCDNCQSPGEIIDWTDIAQSLAWEARSYILEHAKGHRGAESGLINPPRLCLKNPTVKEVTKHFLKKARKNDWILPPFRYHRDVPLWCLEELCYRLAARRILGFGVLEPRQEGAMAHCFYLQLDDPQALVDFLRTKESFKIALRPGKRSKHLLVPWEIRAPQMVVEIPPMPSGPSSCHSSPDPIIIDSESAHVFNPSVPTPPRCQARDSAIELPYQSDSHMTQAPSAHDLHGEISMEVDTSYDLDSYHPWSRIHSMDSTIGSSPVHKRPNHQSSSFSCNYAKSLSLLRDVDHPMSNVEDSEVEASDYSE